MAPSDWWVGDKSNDIFCCFVLLRADACSSCNFVLCVEIETLKGKLCIILSPFHRKYPKNEFYLQRVKGVQLQPLRGVLHNKCPNLIRLSRIHQRWGHDKCLNSRCFLLNFAKILQNSVLWNSFGKQLQYLTKNEFPSRNQSHVGLVYVVK